MPNDNEYQSTTLKTETLRKVKSEAALLGLTMSEMIELALDKWIKEKEVKDGKNE